MKLLHILVVNPLWPHPSHSIRAANVVLFELIKEFAAQEGIRVSFLKLTEGDNKILTSQEKEGLEALQKKNVNIVSELHFPSVKPKQKWRKVVWPNISDFYPQKDYADVVSKKISSINPDVVFIPWSEWATALCADLPFVKFAYYGNVDHKAAVARARFRFTHEGFNFLRYAAEMVRALHFERVHVNTIKKYEFLSDVAANDAQYYTLKGHQNAFYMQNLWIDRFGEEWRNKRSQLEQKSPAIIIASIGKLDGTANTHGLEILGKELLPELKNVLDGIPYEVHIFGANRPHPSVEKYLHAPEVRLRGFVDDIDREMLASSIFLCLNNGSAYKSCHTRYLHAWSLGCCVIAHQDVRLSMPEMVHQSNVLLGCDVKEIAQQVKEAILDHQLRHRIGEGGYKTFLEHFTARRVVPKIIERMKAYCEYNTPRI